MPDDARRRTARLIEGLRALDRAYSPGHHGRWSAARRAELVDEALRDLFAASGAGERVALVALGGYGRGALCPASDVDLMVLHAERRPERVREVAEAIFYPLWDAGIALGHAVRTAKQALEEGRVGIDSLTALLEGRLLAGDAALFDDLRRRLASLVHADPGRFVARVREADAARHGRHGSAAHLMVPDVKEASGGLRDVHSVTWAGRAVGAADAEALEEVTLLRRSEREALEDAEEFLVRVRSALHLATGKRTDRLLLELQPRLAEDFGFDATAGLDAADALMRALFGHARHVEHVRALAFERIGERAAGGRRGARGRGAPGDGGARSEPAPVTPEEVMETFAAWAGGGPAPPARTLDDIEHRELAVAAWPERALEQFVSILASGETGARALEAMDRIGVLSRFVPEWDDVRCRPQRDPYHTYTVDLHLIRTAAEASRLLAGDGRDPLAREAARAVRDRRSLLLGAFLHDAGKVGRGGHVAAGVHVAGAVLERMGVDTATRERVLFLVREHLLLADTATRRDLTDPALVADVAGRVGDQEGLALLYLLTLADAAATGPHASTSWRLALVRELVTKVERVLEGAAAPPRPARDRSDALREALRGADAGEVEAFLARMPERYLAAVEPLDAGDHFRLLHPEPAPAEVRTAVRRDGGAATYRLSVAAADRPGLLAKIAGALTLSGLSILSAEAFTTDDGVALDVFEVVPAFDGEVDEERWRRFRADLRRAIEGRISLEYRVAEKRRHYPPAPAGIETRVVVDNEASSEFTVIEVFAPDRVGLLFQVARAFHELELDVHLAKVATYGGRVVDAFYVRDLYGKKVEDAEQVREIERAIVATLAER